MRSAILFIALAVVESSVMAQAIMHTITPTGTYTVTLGTSETIVDVYKLTFDAGPGRTLGAIVLDIGTIGGHGGDDPFQAWYVIGGKKGETIGMTPTQDDADDWLYADPPDGTNCYQADTHFLPEGFADWAPVVVSPTEGNDASIYDEGVLGSGMGDYRAGAGSLSVAAAVPAAEERRVIDIVQVGVIRGTTIRYPWCDSRCATDQGYVTNELFLIPEPATLSLLVAGTLALLRRRAGRR